MKQKLIGSLLLTTALFACSDDKKNDIVTPEETKLSFKSILCNDAQLEESLSVNATTKLKFEAELSSNEEDYSIAWILNGDTLAKGLEQSYDLEGRSGTFKAVLISNQTQVDEKTVELVGPYKNGSFMYTSTADGNFDDETHLVFINTKPELLINEGQTNLFLEVNPDKSESPYRNIISVNNKLYITQSANIEIADAQTLKSIETLKNIQAEEVAVINSKKLLVRSNRGILTMDIKSKEEGKPLTLSANPNKTRMAVLKDYTALAAENKIIFIAHSTLAEYKSISFDEDAYITNVITGNDGYLYAFMSNSEGESQTVFTRIDPNKLEVVESNTIDNQIISEEISNLYVTKDTKQNLFYFGVSSYDEGTIDIFKVAYDGKSSLIKTVVDEDLIFSLSGYLDIYESQLYIPVVDYNSNTPYVLDLQSNDFLEYNAELFNYSPTPSMVSRY